MMTRQLPEPPLTGAADARWSVISSAHDLYTEQNDDLVAVALGAAERARHLHLHELEARCGEPDLTWVRTWPGEHYRLLPALVQEIGARRVVEVGTYKGHGTLAIAAASDQTDVVTYDLIAWDQFADTALQESDLIEGRIVQRLGDLGDPAYREEQWGTLREADLLFIDGPKDGVWEQHAVREICEGLTDRRRLIVFDDIRLMPMVQLWRDLAFPKLDITSLGHWSGTGLMWTR
jgi:predicted O-methyltransferase YrrM